MAGDFEFEIKSLSTSRTAGGIALDDEVYLSCDLGFVWARLPDGTPRTMLNVIWLFKDWHEEAINNGGIRIRKDGKIYDAHLVLERDPGKIERLKTTIETLAQEFMNTTLPPRTTTQPNDILFFKILPSN